MQIDNNRFIIQKKNKQGDDVYRVLTFKKVIKMTNQVKEMSKFLFAQADILTACYWNYFSFGTLLTNYNANLIYGFFGIGENKELKIAIKESERGVNSLDASYISSYSQTLTEDFNKAEMEHVFNLINAENLKIGLVTGIPSAKHSKTDVSRPQGNQDSFNKGGEQTEQQMEEFVKSVNSEDFLFINIIQPLPATISRRVLSQLSSLQTEMEMGAEYQKSINGGFAFPLGLNWGGTDGTSDGHSIGKQDNWNINSSENTGNALGINHSLGLGFAEGDNYNLTSGLTLNTGLTEGDNINYQRGLNEGWAAQNGYNYNSTDGLNYNYSHGAGTGSTYNENVSGGYNNNISAGFNQTHGTAAGIAESYNLGFSDQRGNSLSAADGQGLSDSYNYGGSISGNRSFSSQDSYGLAENENNGYSRNINNSGSLSGGINSGDQSTTGVNILQTVNQSSNNSLGINANQTQTWGDGLSNNYGKGISYNVNNSLGDTTGYTNTFNEGAANTYSRNTTMNYAINEGQSGTVGIANSINRNVNDAFGYNSQRGYGETFNRGLGYSEQWNDNITNGVGYQKSTASGTNVGNTYNLGINDSISSGKQTSINYGASTQESASYGKNATSNYNYQKGYNLTYNKGVTDGWSYGGGGNEGYNFTRNVSYTNGANFGFSPQLGFGRNITVRDHVKKYLVGLINSYKTDIEDGLKTGNFVVTSYFIAKDDNTFTRGRQGLQNALGGDSSPIPMVIDSVPENETKSVQRKLQLFGINYEKFPIENQYRPWLRATIVNNKKLSAQIHVPRFDSGKLVICADDIPRTRVPLPEDPEISLEVGKVIIPEFARVNEKIPLRIRLDQLSNTIFAGGTGSGKSVAAMTYYKALFEKRINGKPIASGIIFDWNPFWRNFFNALPRDQIEHYTFGDDLSPYRTNLAAIPIGVKATEHFSGTAESFTLSGQLGPKTNTMMYRAFFGWATGQYLEKIEDYLEKIELDMKMIDIAKKEGKAVNVRASKGDLQKLKTKLLEVKGLNIEVVMSSVVNSEMNNENPSNENKIQFAFNIEEKLRVNSRKITLDHHYYLFEASRLYDFMEKDQREAIERILERLAIFTLDGPIKENFCYNLEDMKEIGSLLEQDKVVIFEGTAIQTQSELKQFIVYTLSSDIFAYVSNKYAKREKFNTYKALVYEEASDIIPNGDVAKSDKQVLAISMSVYDRIATQSRKFKLLMGIVVQEISHLSGKIISSCPTAFCFRTQKPEDQDIILARLGKTNTYDPHDQLYRKLIPKLPTGWGFCHKTAGNGEYGELEPILFKANFTELIDVSDDDIRNRLLREEFGMVS